MNPCDELRAKLLADLNSGIVYTDSGKQKMIEYDVILKHYCTATVPRNLFLEKYKSLTPIECYQDSEKREWKAFVNEIFPGTSPQFRLEAVKIIYTIGQLTN